MKNFQKDFQIFLDKQFKKIPKGKGASVRSLMDAIQHEFPSYTRRLAWTRLYTFVHRAGSLFTFYGQKGHSVITRRLDLIEHQKGGARDHTNKSKERNHRIGRNKRC